MKYIKLLLLIFVSITASVVSTFFLKSGKVQGVYQDISYIEKWGRECKSTIVLINNSPLTQEKLRELWMREKNVIINKWNPLTNNCDYLLFVNNALETPQDSEEMKYWIGDYQICLKGTIEKCISKDERLFYVGMDKRVYGDNIAGEVNNNNLYIHYLN